MALSNYTELCASVAVWLNRTDLTSIIPDFVTLAEARVARDLRLRAQVTNDALTTVAGDKAVALPSDWLEFENLTITSTDPKRTLHVVTPEYLDERWPENAITGIPTDYTVVGGNLELGPTPDAAYTISADYYQRFPALSSSSTNWLLTNHPNIYLFAALAEGSLFMMDEQRAAMWEGKYEADATALQDADDKALRSGSSMRVRTIP